MKSTVSGVYEALKFKISEGYKQNWSCPGSALLAVSVWSEPSEILNLRSSNTSETVLVSIPWYLEVLENMTSPKLYVLHLAPFPLMWTVFKVRDHPETTSTYFSVPQDVDSFMDFKIDFYCLFWILHPFPSESMLTLDGPLCWHTLLI